MKNRKFVKVIGFYSVFLGLSVFAMWFQILMNETIPEGRTEMSFHLFSEFLMALLCLVSGFLLIGHKSKGRITNAAAHAMVVYSLINAIGYYAERDEKSIVPVFIVLCILSLLILASHLLHPYE
ncbi:MAG: hypothetical protein K9J30_14235 [Bacteroidales bacterium]|nr:hypothetical protein [Bacteroidales bacterium]